MADDKKKRDLLQITGVTKDGDYSYVRQRPDDDIEVGLLRTPEEGKPMQRPVALKALNDSGFFEVEPLVEPLVSPSKGPTKVTTEEYRVGWERVCGKKLLN